MMTLSAVANSSPDQRLSNFSARPVLRPTCLEERLLQHARRRICLPLQQDRQ
ncbi:unnamed protein product, partial [Protopolystoma xenopodis]